MRIIRQVKLGSMRVLYGQFQRGYGVSEHPYEDVLFHLSV